MCFETRQITSLKLLAENWDGRGKIKKNKIVTTNSVWSRPTLPTRINFVTEATGHFWIFFTVVHSSAVHSFLQPASSYLNERRTQITYALKIVYGLTSCNITDKTATAVSNKQFGCYLEAAGGKLTQTTTDRKNVIVEMHSASDLVFLIRMFKHFVYECQATPKKSLLAIENFSLWGHKQCGSLSSYITMHTDYARALRITMNKAKLSGRLLSNILPWMNSQLWP